MKKILFLLIFLFFTSYVFAEDYIEYTTAGGGGLDTTAGDARYLMLNQSTSQTVSNGAPIFADNITIGDNTSGTFKITFDEDTSDGVLDWNGVTFDSNNPWNFDNTISLTGNPALKHTTAVAGTYWLYTVANDADSGLFYQYVNGTNDYIGFGWDSVAYFYIYRTTGNLIWGTGTGTGTFNIKDAVANSFRVKEGVANDYIDINTSDGTEVMTFGNATTNPKYYFKGTNPVSFNSVWGSRFFADDVIGTDNLITSNTVSFNTITSLISTSTVMVQGAYKLPNWDGTKSQVMTTDGQGNVSWSTVTGGGGGGGGGGGLTIAVTYNTVILLPESSVLDDSSPPAITVVESTGTGTPRFRVADFDATTDEIIYWTFVIPFDYVSANTIAHINWYSNDIGANETCVWGSQISATSSGAIDSMSEQACDGANVASGIVNSTEANRLIRTTMLLGNKDNMISGDTVTLRFYRDADNGSDNLTSDARLHSILIEIPTQ